MKFKIILGGLIFSCLMAQAQISATLGNSAKPVISKISKKTVLTEEQIFSELLKTKSDIDGNKINPIELKGKTILLSFQEISGAANVVFYRKIIRFLNEKVPNLKVIIIAKGDGDADQLKTEWKNIALQEEMGITTMVDNEDMDLFSAISAYQVFTFPTSIHVNENGKILNRYIGADSVQHMATSVQKASLSAKNQHEIDFINQASSLSKKFQSSRGAQEILQLLSHLDPINPYTPKLKAKMQGKLAIAKTNLSETRQLLAEIKNEPIKWEQTLEFAKLLFEKKQVNESLSFVRSVMDDILTVSTLGLIDLDKINLYGEAARLYTKLVTNKGNEDSYISYLKPIFETCKFFPSDPHTIVGTEGPEIETLLVYQYAMALSNKDRNSEVAKVWASYLHAEPDPEVRKKEVIKKFKHVEALSEQFKSIQVTGNESNREKLFKICLRPDINGKVNGLSNLNAKYILLDFWASWCTPCRASHPHLKEVYARYKDKGLEMIGIAGEHSTDENMRVFTCRRAAEQDGITWIQLLDEINETEKVQVAPFTTSKLLVKKVLFDKEGKVHGIFEGKDAEGLDKKLAELMP